MNNDTKVQPNGPRPGAPGNQTSMTPSSPVASPGTEGTPGVGTQAKQAATEIAVKAKDKLGSELEAQKDRAAGSIGNVAEALRETGRSMRSGDTAFAADYADRLADRVEGITDYVRGKTVGQMAADAERFARREPALFLGGAFAIGLVAGRFLKSSSRKNESGNNHNEPFNRGDRRFDVSTGTEDRGGRLGPMSPHPVQSRPPTGPATLAGVGGAGGIPATSYSPPTSSAYSGTEKGTSKP